MQLTIWEGESEVTNKSKNQIMSLTDVFLALEIVPETVIMVMMIVTNW